MDTTDNVKQHPCPSCGKYTTNDTFCDDCQPNLDLRPPQNMAGQVAPVNPAPTLGDILSQVTAIKTLTPPPPPSDPIMDLIARAQETLRMQVAGNHYQRAGATIQPIEFFHDNNIPYPEASAMGYLYRWRDKGGVQDLKKAIQTIVQLIAMEERKKQRQASA